MFKNYLAGLLILRSSSCCLRHPYGVMPRGLYTFRTWITSNTTRPSPGWRRSPPSPSRLAPSASWATSTRTDVFVVGYGIDYAGAYRNLRDIHALEPGTTEG